MKKLLGLCCLVGIVSFANAFDEGKYICEGQGMTYTIELKKNGRYEALGVMPGLPGANTRGEWIDDGNGAIIKEDNKKRKEILEKVDTGYVYANIFSCRKEGEVQKNKVENDFRIAPKKEVVEKLVNEFVTTKNPNQFKEVCRIFSAYEFFHTNEAFLDMEQFAKDKDGKQKDITKEDIRKLVKPLDEIKPVHISNACNNFSLTYGNGTQQIQSVIVQCKVLCEERLKQSLEYAKNTDNYIASKK